MVRDIMETGFVMSVVEEAGLNANSALQWTQVDVISTKPGQTMRLKYGIVHSQILPVLFYR